MRDCSKNLRKNKVLLFKNIMESCEGKDFHCGISCGTHYLISALEKTGIPFVLSGARISLQEKEFINPLTEFESILQENPDINFIIISLSEFYFEKVKLLTEFLRRKSSAFICVGAVMPTLAPRHVFVHLPVVNIIVRGIGEEILPKIIRILNGKNISSGIGTRELNNLAALSGVLFSCDGKLIEANPEYINLPRNYDRSHLSFSAFSQEDSSQGLRLFTSWGCFNNCLFCTGFAKGRYTAKSFDNLRRVLAAYSNYINDNYEASAPAEVFRISFYDDDFLGDPQRSVKFFNYIKKTQFKINFFQTGINSFFRKSKDGRKTKLNEQLLNSITAGIFDEAKQVNIYIGLENLCDKELKRLGKGYDFVRAEKVISALAKRRIKVAYHFIASNQQTSLSDVLKNIFNFTRYQKLYGEYFKILTPVIPYLVSLYPSASYKIIEKNKTKNFLEIRQVLHDKTYPEYDYPLVKRDLPQNRVVREIIPFVEKIFNNEADYSVIFDNLLLQLLILSEKNNYFKKEVKPLIDKYKDYPAMFGKKIKFQKNNRGNLQLMITRRCHLRCKYCPIAKRKEDMSETVLKAAVDFLFSSSLSELRLDFTGGEPLLRFDLIKQAVGYARNLAQQKNKSISFYMVTNLIALNDEIADFLAKEKFLLELSLDGEEISHNLYKVGRQRHINPYRLTTEQLKKILSRNINSYAVMVVSVSTVCQLYRNFCHLIKLGIKNIGINYALCSLWDEPQRGEFFRQMELIKRNFFPYINKKNLNLGNLGSRDEPAVLNSEVMVDCDGKVHFLTDWLFEKGQKNRVPALGDIHDFKSPDDIFMSRFKILQRLFEYNNAAKKKVVLNNVEMGTMVKGYFDLWKEKLRQ